MNFRAKTLIKFILIRPSRAVIFWFLFLGFLPNPKDLFAQTDYFRGWEDIRNRSFAPNRDRKVLRAFRIPESWDAERLIARAEEHIQAAEYTRAVAILQQVIDEHTGHVFQVGIDAFRDSKVCARFLGAGELAHFLLMNLPPPGREVYESFVTDKIENRLAKARVEGDIDSLQKMGETFAASKLGQQAFRYLAEYYLERGECETASVYLKKILLFQNPKDPDVKARLVQALDQLGIEEEKKTLIEELEEATPLLDGNEKFLVDLKRSPSIRTRPGSDWPTCGGNNARSRPMPLFMEVEGFTSQWERMFLNDRLARYSPFFSLYRSNGAIPFRLLRSGEYLIVNDSISARAYNIFTGELIWHFKGPMEVTEDSDEHYDLEDYTTHLGMYASNRTSTTISAYLIASGTVSGDMVFFNLQAKRRKKIARILDQRVINKAIPSRALFALNLADGRLLWAQGDREAWSDDFMSRLSIPSPPIVKGNRVFCNGYVREGGINSYILCFDRDTGDLIWKVSAGIGQQELTMFNMEYKEFTMTPLAEIEGTLVFCSNLGFVCGLDALSGRIRWITEYETIPLPQANLFERMPKPRPVFWRNNPAVVDKNYVVVTPLDSMHILALDWRTGKTRWKLNANNLGLDYYPSVLGIHDGEVILSGESGALALDLESGVRAWRVLLPPEQMVNGRGALSETHLYLPVGENVLVYDLASGKAVSQLVSGFRYPPLNLFLLGEVIALVGLDSINLFFDAEGMLARAEERYRKGKVTLKDLAFIGDMHRLNMNFQKAISYYEKTLDRASEKTGVRSVDLANIRSSLHGSYLALGHQYLMQGENAKAEEMLKAALGKAPGNDLYLQAALELVDFYKSTNESRALSKLLDDIMARCPDHLSTFSYEEGLVDVPAGFFVLHTRYCLAEDRGDATGAVAALQSIVENYPKVEFQRRSARDGASDLIDDIIEREGREVYAAYDERASSELEEALASGRLSLLERIAERFPNAQVSGRVALEIAKIFLDQGDASSVYPYLTDFLKGRREAAERPHAFYLMAQAAEMDGNPAFAQALKRRILERYASVELPWNEDVTYRSLFHGLPRSRLDSSEAPALPEGEYETHIEKFAALQCRFLSPEGGPVSFMDKKTLLGVQMNNGTWSLTLYDFEVMEKVWTRDLSRYLPSRGRDLDVGLYYLNEVLAAVFEEASMIIGINLRTGDIVWETDPKGLILDWDFAQGLICCVTAPLPGDEESEEMEVMAINPAGGGILWRNRTDLSIRASVLPSDEAFCVCSPSTRREGPRWWIFDPLTGEEVEKLALDDGVLSPLPFTSPRGMVLAIWDREIQGGRYGGRGKSLLACHPRGGNLLWEVPLEKWLIKPKSSLLTQGRLGFFAQDRTAHRGRMSLILIDLAKGEVSDEVVLDRDWLAIPDYSILPDDFFFLRNIRSPKHTLRLSAFSLSTMDYRFRDRLYQVGDSGTGTALPGRGIYTRDGAVIPLDFEIIVKRQDRKQLCSQVLLVEQESGKVRYVLDLYWSSDKDHPFLYTRRYPLEVFLKEDAVLVLKRSELYVIKGNQTGG